MLDDILKLRATYLRDSGFEELVDGLCPPATAKAVDELELAMGVKIDSEYRQFLLVTDGLRHVTTDIHLFGTHDFTSTVFSKVERDKENYFAEIEQDNESEKFFSIGANKHGQDILLASKDEDFISAPYVWLASDEVLRRDSFFDFLQALITG